MSAKFRIGQISAGDVAVGDILLDAPYDQGGIRLERTRVVGTVLHVRGDETRSWLIETSSGAIEEWPEDGPVGRYVNTRVHVPRTEIDTSQSRR